MVNPGEKVSFRIPSDDESTSKSRSPFISREKRDEFQRVLAKDPHNKGESQEEETTIKKDRPKDSESATDKEEMGATEGRKSSNVNLFDLSAQTGKGGIAQKKEKTPIAIGGNLVVQGGDKEQEHGLFGLAESKAQESKGVAFAKEGKEGSLQDVVVSPEEKPKEASIAVQKPQEGALSQTGIPLQQGAPLTVESSSSPMIEPKGSRINELQAVINKITDQITVIEKNGVTHSVITIKDHPILNGAQIVLTGFDSARKEFNIAFQGLTQQGQNLILMNRDGLQLALENKGFTIHILTASTLVEPVIKEQGENMARQQNPEDRQRQGKQGQQNPDEEQA